MARQIHPLCPRISAYCHSRYHKGFPYGARSCSVQSLISIVTNTTGEAQRWDEYVSRSPCTALYHLYSWRQVIEETFDHPTFYLSALAPSSQVVGILPLVQLKSRVFGNMLVSLPFFNYGGICGESDEVRLALLQAAIRLAKEKKTDFVEIRHEDDWDQGLQRKTTKVSFSKNAAVIGVTVKPGATVVVQETPEQVLVLFVPADGGVAEYGIDG